MNEGRQDKWTFGVRLVRKWNSFTLRRLCRREDGETVMRLCGSFQYRFIHLWIDRNVSLPIGLMPNDHWSAFGYRHFLNTVVTVEEKHAIHVWYYSASKKLSDILQRDSTRLRRAQANARGPLCLGRCSEWHKYFTYNVILSNAKRQRSLALAADR